MAIIEFAGRLREHINLDGTSYQCNDVNLDKDFLINLSKVFIRTVGNEDTEIQLKYSRFFDEEIIGIVKFDINIDAKKYKLTFTRNTHSNKIIIGCEIETIEFEDELFGTIYDLKIKVINLFNRICENSSIYLLQDFNNELICQSAYLQIHKVENRFRNLLTKYLMRKYGSLVLTKSLKKDVDDYSEWFKKVNKNKYRTFKRVNTDYANLDFLKLVKLLDLYDAKCIDESGSSITSNLEDIVNGLTDDIEYTTLNSSIAKIKEKLSKRVRVFDDKSLEQSDGEIESMFGFKSENKGLITILDSDFRRLWESELSKMRNMVAHNKPICEELYSDILDKCRIVNERFDKCFEYINRYFFSDEEGVLSALVDMAYEEKERNYFYIEEARESVGIQFSLSEEFVEYKLIECSKQIEKFIDTVSVLKDMRNYVECIDGLNEELRFIDDESITIELKRKIFNLIKESMLIECGFEEYQGYELIEMLYELVYKDIDIEKAISFYLNDSFSSFMDDKFELFSLDYQIKWLTIDGKEYEIVFYGQLNPENGGTDYLEFDLYIDKKKAKNYTITVDYGDYMTPSDGDIDDTIVEALVDDIESSIDETVSTYKTIYQLSEKIFEEL